MIPDEAVEEALARLPMDVLRYMDADDMRRALEAAAPYLLSRERQQTVDAHRDAMVNRETKRSELAQAWGEGWDAAAGWPQIDKNPYKEEQK